MNNKGMKATTLRAILLFAVIVSLVASVIGFSFAKKFLTDYAVTVSHSVADSQASVNNIQTLRTLQQTLTQQKDAEAKAAEIFSPLSNYQNQVITDIDNYAAITGISVENYSFTAAAVATTPTTGATTGTTVATSALSSPTQNVTVTINSPVSYSRLLKFIRAIETSLPKMQISSINIGRAADSDAVTTDTLTIAVFTR